MYEMECIKHMANELKKYGLDKSQDAELVPRETLLEGFGHGWHEGRYVMDGDESAPEYTLTECVWINGCIALADGDADHADSRYYVENYGSLIRIWKSLLPPDEEQRWKTPWKE